MMSQSQTNKSTGLSNSAYNLMIAIGKDAKFIYSTVDTYISDAQKENRQELADMWNTIKKDRQRHLQMLRDELKKEASEGKIQ